MSSIDLVILGIVQEKPQSAYDIQQDVDAHHFSRWTKISTASVYRRVLRLQEAGYLHSETVPGARFASKAVYSITPEGRAYFQTLLQRFAAQPVPLCFDFNVVIANLNKLPLPEALALLDSLQASLQASLQTTEDYADQFSQIPLTGRTIFHQQIALYKALLSWLEEFRAELSHEPQQPDHPL